MAQQIEDPKKNLLKVHAKLSEINPDFQVSKQDFLNDMQNPEKLQKVHQFLSSNVEGFNVDYNTFSSDMGLKKKDGQSSPESSNTSSKKPFDPIQNRKQVYDAKLEEFIQSDEVINNRAQEILGDFQQRVQSGEFENTEQANKAYQQAIKNDEIIRAKKGEYVKYVEDEFNKDIDAIEKFDRIKQEEESKPELERNPLYSFGKKAAETFTSMIPMAAGAKQAATLSNIEKNAISELESLSDVSNDKTMKLPSLTDRRGGGKREYNVGEYKQKLIEKISKTNKAKGAALEYAIQNKMEMGDSDVISSLSDIDDGVDLVNFIAGSVGQAVSQIPLTVASGGGSSVAIESGTTYLNSVMAIAEEKGITPKEVINQGLDNQILSDVAGGLAASLDLVGAKKVIDAFGIDNIKKDFRKRALKLLTNSQVEGLTETAQGVITGQAESIASKGELSSLNASEMLDEYAAGVFGVAGMQSPTLISKKAKVSKQKPKIKDPEIQAKQIEDGQETGGQNNQVDATETTTDSQNQPDATTGTEQSQQNQSAEPEAGETVQLEEIDTDTLEKRQSELESDLKNPKNKEEFNNIDKELEKREWVDIMSTPLDELSEKADELIQKEKDKPNGFGTYAEKSSLNQLKTLNEELSNLGGKSDKFLFTKLEENIDYASNQEADGIRFREYFNELTNRGVEPNEIVSELAQKYVYGLYSLQDGVEVVLNKFEKIFRNSEIEGTRQKNQPLQIDDTNEVKNISNDPGQQSINESINQEIESTTNTEIIQEGAKKGTKQVEVKFKQAFDKEKHSNLSPEIQESLKKGKTENFDVTQEDISTLIGNPDVESIQWKLPKTSAPNTDATTQIKQENTKVTDQKGEKSATRKELEKNLETGKIKVSQYAKRRLADVKDTDWARENVKKNSTYKESSKNKAKAEATRIISDFKKNIGEKDGLRQAFTMLKNDDFPAIMKGIVAAKINYQMQMAGMRKEAAEVFKWDKEKGTDWGLEGLGRQADASPESVVAAAFTRVDQKQIEAWEKAKAKNGNPLITEVEKLKEQVINLEQEIRNNPPKKKITKTASKENKSKDLLKRAKDKRKEGLSDIDNFFKKQRGKLNAGIPLDSELFNGIKKVFESYVLEFRGNTEIAFQKLKRELRNVKGLKDENLDDYRNEITKDIQPTIDEVIKEEQVKIVQDFLNKNRKNKKIDEKVNKQRAEEIVEEFNKNKDEEVNEFATLFDKEAGFNTLSQEQRNEIFKEVEEIAKLDAEGQYIVAAKKYENLRNDLIDKGIDGHNIIDFITDIWYTNTLSGITTANRSIFGSTLTTLEANSIRLLNQTVQDPKLGKHLAGIFANPKRLVEASREFGNVVRTGDSNVQIRDIQTSSPNYFKKVVNKNYFGDNLTLTQGIAKTLSSLQVWMFRTLPGWDVFLTNYSKEFNYSVNEYVKALDMTKDRKKAFAEMLKSRNLSQIEDFKEQAQKDYEFYKKKDPKLAKQLGTSFPTRRYKELLDASRNRESTKIALEESKKAAMINDPEGLLGNIYDRTNRFFAAKADNNRTNLWGNLAMLGLKVTTVPFLRVFTNYINKGLDYTPVGAVRSFKKTTWTLKGEREIPLHEAQEKGMRAAIGYLAAGFIASSIFDFDDENEEWTLKKDPIIKINGSMVKYYDREKVDGKRKPWSIAVKIPGAIDSDGDGYSKYFSFIDNPIGLMLAPLAMLHDEILYDDFKDDVSGVITKKKKRGAWDLMVFYVMSMGNYASSQSFAQSFSDLADLMDPDMDSDRKSKKIKGFLTRPAVKAIPFAGASIYMQLEQQYDALNDIPVKQAQGWYEEAIKNIPLAQSVIENHKYDVFGYPIKRKLETPFFPDFVLEVFKENLDYRERHKEWELIRKYPQVNISNFNLPRQINNNRNIEEEKRTEFMRIAGEYFSQSVREDYEYLNTLGPVELQIELNYLRTAAYQTAKGEMDLIVQEDL